MQKNLLCLLTAMLLTAALTQAQVTPKDSTTRLHHSLLFTTGYTATLSRPLQHGLLIGIGYRARIAPIYSISITAMAGPRFISSFSAALDTRLFIDHEFRLPREHTVQPVFHFGTHIGSMQQMESSHHYFVFGANFGAGAEVIFGRKHGVAGLHARFFVSYNEYLSYVYVHLQPSIAYRL